MRMTKEVLAFVLALALAAPALTVPAVAFGQSAGDEQYVDPFQGQDDDRGGSGGGGSGSGSGSEGGSQGGGGGGGGSATPAPVPEEAPAEVAPDTASAETDVGSTTSSTDPTLPRTGLALGGLVGIGLVLLGGGITLRRLA
jgi:hypothetical protein